MIEKEAHENVNRVALGDIQKQSRLVPMQAVLHFVECAEPFRVPYLQRLRDICISGVHGEFMPEASQKQDLLTTA